MLIIELPPFLLCNQCTYCCYSQSGTIESYFNALGTSSPRMVIDNFFLGEYYDRWNVENEVFGNCEPT